MIEYDSNRAKRAPAIDSVRGLACLMIVALHIVGDSENTGLHLPMTSNWHYAMQSLEFLRIPLFTTLSGYLYAANRVTAPTFKRFWLKKVRRLGIPLIFVTTVVWNLRQFAYVDTTPLPVAILFPFGHLWYIQALLILFTVISIVDAVFRSGSTPLVLAGLTAVMLAQGGVPVPTFFSLDGACYLAPYFLFGIVLRDRAELLDNRQVGTIALGIVVIVLAAQQLGFWGLTNRVELLQLPAALAGMAFVVFLLQRFPRNAMLGMIGFYSYTIYLWHIVAGAAARTALMKAGITNVPTLFSLGFAVGVLAPIVLYHVARRIPLLSTAVTGEKWLRREQPMAWGQPERIAVRS
jgi:surface polysaccharide O-acyltransferase-like enzyme